MAATLAGDQAIATNFGANLGKYLTLLSALTLQANAGVGATTVSVDLQVQVGDILVFDKGTGTEEAKTVTAVTGSGPYTATISALANARSSGALISHVPVSSATVHELSVTRVAAGWGAADPTGKITSSPASFSVAAGAKVGSAAAFDSLTGGVFYDAQAGPAALYGAPATVTATYTFKVQ